MDDGTKRLTVISVIIAVVIMIGFAGYLFLWPKTMQGVITDCETGDPIEGATILTDQSGISFFDGSFLSICYENAPSNIQGQFEAKYRYPQDVIFWIKKDGYEYTQPTFSPGDQEPICLTKGHSIPDIGCKPK